MRPKRNREINIVSLSFLDVLANTVGGLVFLLIFSMLLIGGIAIQFRTPQITTDLLPDGYHQQPYVAWLAAREGLGEFEWTAGPAGLPVGLKIDTGSGKIS